MKKNKNPHDPSRRHLLQSLSAIALASTLPARHLQAANSLRFSSDPFLLGIASGYPSSNGVILWTRLVTALTDPSNDVGDLVIPVEWEIASDSKMRKVVRQGIEHATRDFAHSVHIEVTGLKPGRDYWYRFTAGGMRSSIGRTRTAPALDAMPKHLRIAVASCQKYENGYFVAYQHMLNDDLDLIVHTGDYIYEYASNAGGGNVRGDGSGEAFTLDQYRARYALYKHDADLRAAHATYPWMMTWDDHEVANDYSGDSSYEQTGEEFLLRRAAAYRAYYEHMPLPRSALPVGPHMTLHTSNRFGELLQIHMLDSRQYRSPMACRGPGEDDGPGARCAALFDSTRTKLGAQQEAWLSTTLAKRSARWNVLAQGTPMVHVDLDPGEGVAYRRDSWDGYPAARQRLLDTLVDTKTSNPIVIDGDIHAFQVAGLNAKANDPVSPVIASEFTTDSVTSSGISQARLDQNRLSNPNILFSESRQRGYTVLDFSAQSVRAELLTVETIRQPVAGRNLAARFVVENGRPGPIKD